MRKEEIRLKANEAFVFLCRDIMHGKSCDELTDITGIFAVSVLEYMALQKGITDVRDFGDVAVQISHYIESELRDYIDYHINQEYGCDD